MDGLIQIIIIACLLIIIFLLAVDKVKIVKSTKQETGNDETSEIKDIMGRPNVIRERPIIKPTDIHKKMLSSTHRIPVAKPLSAEVAGNESTDERVIYEDEPLPYDDRFSQAVSMEEMMNVGKLLQQNDFGPEQEDMVIDVMQKIQGTELYGLLENSIGDASKRITALLDKNLNPSGFRDFETHNSTDKFDIDDFI